MKTAKSKKKMLAVSFCVAAVLMLTGIKIWKASTAENSTAADIEVKAGIGEEIIYGELQAVRGNEIIYLRAEETEESDAAPMSFPGGQGASGGNSMPLKRPEEKRDMASYGTYSYNNITVKVTEQEDTALIPVGTEVTTKLGTTTTFSRLAAGDFIAIVRDKGTGEITKVYILA